jgi:hypothetical protein
MRETNATGPDRNTSDDLIDFPNYLPATPRISTKPGRVEWLLTRLFRQGERRAAVQHEN